MYKRLMVRSPRTRPDKRRELNARQAAFVRNYTAGADGVRGNATASAIASGYTPKYANKCCPMWIGKSRSESTCPAVWDAVAAIRAKAEAKTIRKLRDWKELAVDAQDLIAAVRGGVVLSDLDADERREETAKLGHDPGDKLRERIRDRDKASIAKLQLEAASEILERAYPKKLYSESTLSGGITLRVVYEDKRPDEE